MKKQISISLLFAVLMSMTGLNASAHDFAVANAEGKIIYYIYNSDGTTVSVSYRGNSIGAYTNEYSGAIVIPESVTNNAKTYSVTSIGPDAFRGCSGLTSVTIGNSVTSIGERTFSACSGLTSIIVESGNIVYDSRDNCNAIIETASNTLISGCKNTTIPNSVTSIGDYAFAYCSSLTSVTIPNSVTGIGNYAFLGCRGLTSITIPNSVTSIGYNAFEYCDGLTSISIPNSVTSIGSYAFRDCSGLTSVYINDIESWCKITFITVESNPLYYAHHLYMNGSEITQLVIPNSVTSIGNHTFSGSSGLTSVTIHNSVTSIGESAFNGCSGLTSITIPNSVTSIGNYAFFGCSGLTSVTIPNSVTSIGWGTFKGCSSLTSIIIPNSVTVISSEAFYECSGLTSITIPNSVTSIGYQAFFGCSGLTSVTIPNSVTSIGSSAFMGCKSLTSIEIPANVTSIGTGAFFDCSALETISVASGNTTYHSEDNCLIEMASHTLIAGCKNSIIPNGVTSIGGAVFQNCSGLTSITIPNSVTSIGNYAFKGCSGLTSITIPNSVTSIGYQAFFGCSGLASVIVEIDPPLAIPSDTFIGCYNATLYVPAGSKAKYETADNWKSFKDIVEMGPEKCATPTIKYVGGKLKFECETEGVEFISNFSTPAGVENNTSEVSVPTTYNVSVYAKKDGYLNSDVAKANIDVRGIQGDTNRDGEVTITDAVGVVNIILGNNEATAPALLEPQESEEPE